MNVTVNTDASFSYTHKIGTWAFWMVSNLGRITGSGKFKNGCLDSNEAEMKAICNALTVITENPTLMASVKVIYVNTDSMSAIYVFTNDKKT